VYDGAAQTDDPHDYLAAVLGSELHPFAPMLAKGGDADGDGTTDLVGAFRSWEPDAYVLENPRGLVSIEDAVAAGDVT
ncbi:hypothetical protein, partial [Salmonella sp. SAL4355]|uniref:hypothetical protein n=1 Tax=Salmonella sp. SAL4355 TaxID=3159876 RepID=UPI00397AF25C